MLSGIGGQSGANSKVLALISSGSCASRSSVSCSDTRRYGHSEGAFVGTVNCRTSSSIRVTLVDPDSSSFTLLIIPTVGSIPRKCGRP